MGSKKPQKKKMSPQKQVIKYGRNLVLMTASDYMFSDYGDYKGILTMEGKEAYITNDRGVDTESFYNMMFSQANLDEEIKNLLSKLMYYLTEIPQSKDAKPLYVKASDLVKQITKSMTEAQYFDLSRKILMSSKFGFFLTFLLIILDNEYWPNSFVWGERGGKAVYTSSYIKINDVSVSIPSFLIASIDNIVPRTPEFDLYEDMINSYLSAQSISVDRFTSATEPEVLKLCALSRYYTNMTGLNKFGFGNLHIPTMSEIISFADISWRYEKVTGIKSVVLRNLFIHVDNDIFTRRRYIFKNTVFPELRIAFGETYDDNGDLLELAQTIYNIHVFEKEVETENGSYFMIYMEYTCFSCGVRRTIPIVVDNLTATACSFSVTDQYALFVLLGLYGLTDDLPSEFLQETTLSEIFKAIKEYTSETVSVNIERNHASGYHQTKEVKVEAFVRRLPEGQKASEQAKELARKYRVKLGNEYTIVSPYIRNKSDNN